MTKSLFKILLVCIAVLAMAGCSNTSSDGPLPADKEPEPLDKAGRTVLVYIVARCDLGDPNHNFDKLDLEEMLELRNSELLNDSRLVVYHQPYKGTPRLKVLTPDGFTTLKDYDENEYSVSSKRMLQVIADTKRLTPADRYGLVLWSHATGWIQDGIVDDLPAEESIGTKSYGNDLGRKMNTTTLASVLHGKGFDFIYFDCCHMANVETLYELRHCAGYFIGSATIDPSEGMPYQKTIPYLLRYDADCVGAAAATFTHYDEQTGDDRSMTISVVDASKLEALAKATAEVYAADFALPSGHYVQQFENNGFGLCHYYDLADYVNAASANPELLAKFNQALDEAVVYKANTPSIWGSYLPIRTHCGLSTFILKSEGLSTRSGYNQLQWWEDVASKLFDKE